MSRVYITFSGRAYDRHTAKLVEAHRTGLTGADALMVFDDPWLMQTAFYDHHRWLWHWEQRWGFGWNCWKAYIINRAIERYGHESTILYVDADTYPIADLTPIWNFAQRDGACLFEAQGCLNKRFTRRECFMTMGCDEPRYWEAKHGCGRFSAWRADSSPAMRALDEWNKFLTDQRCQGWGPSTRGIVDFPEFHRHSGDQSILTILAEKYGFPLHREACGYGWPPSPGCGQPDDNYPQLFVQDGYRDPDHGEGSIFRNV